MDQWPHDTIYNPTLLWKRISIIIRYNKTTMNYSGPQILYKIFTKAMASLKSKNGDKPITGCNFANLIQENWFTKRTKEYSSSRLEGIVEASKNLTFSSRSTVFLFNVFWGSEKRIDDMVLRLLWHTSRPMIFREIQGRAANFTHLAREPT